MSKPGALPAQGELPPTQQYLLDSGCGVHQSQLAMPAPVSPDSTGPQLQPNGIQQHQGPVHRQAVVGYHRLPQYSAASQYNLASTQQTMFLTPATHSYVHSQQSQQVYFPVSPSSMASISSTLPSMTPSGTGTIEKREKKILQVVDPKTGQDIMQDIISYSSSKENNAPVNEVAAQFALQVAALATSKENSSVKEEIQDPGKPQISTADFSNGLKASSVDSKPESPTSSVSDSDGANVFGGIGITTVILNPVSKTVPCELNGKLQVNHVQSNEDRQSAGEGEKEFVSSSDSIPVSLVDKINGPEKDSGGVSVSVKKMAVMPKDESAYIVKPSEVETSGIAVEQETVQEIKQISDLKSQEEGIKTDHSEKLAVEKENIGISDLGKDAKEDVDCGKMKELNKDEIEDEKDMNVYLDKKENTIPDLSPTPGQVSPNLFSQESVNPIRMLQEDQNEVEGKTQTNRKFSHEEQVVEKNQINLMDKGENQIIKSNLGDKEAPSKDQNSDDEFNSEKFSGEELVTDKSQINSKTFSPENQSAVDNNVKDCVLNEEQEATEELETVNGQTEGQIILKYNYQADQWSPLNLEGKKQYDRSFLLQLQSETASMKKPQGLPKLDIIKDTATLSKQGDIGKPQNHGQSLSSHSDSFMPIYASGGQQRNDHGGMTGRRHSQHSRDKGKRIFASSFSKDVKLHSSENAWKPSRKAEKPQSQEEQKTEDLYRRVQGILNKLTPQKFQTLVSQVKELPIDNEERLVGVMNLVFKKAIEEPSFSVPYANMCKTLAMMQVPAAEGSNQCVKFSKLLLTKCQREFEKDINDEINKDERLKQIQEAETEEKKVQLQEELDEEETKAKRRSLGNIRFVGELFKLGMLTTLIMHTCIKKLLGQGDEDSLECLCHLLTTIGREIERDKNKSTQAAMDTYFEAMKQIVKKRKTSSRIRFMLQDVIDLRQNNWVSRREDDNPKTIDQIHLEAQKEAQQQHLLLQQVHIVPQKRSEDRERRKSRNNPPVSEEGWSMVTSRSKIDTSKLKQFARGGQAEVENIQLGPGRSFYSWGKGSSGGSKGQDSESRTPNRFSALSVMEQTLNSRTATTQRSAAWESSQNRGSAAVRKTSSQTEQKEPENVKASVKSVLPDVESKPVPQDRMKKSEDPKMTLKGKDMPEEEMELKTVPLIDEFLHNCDFKEATHCVIELVSPSTSCYFISAAINQVLERSSQARHLVGQLLHDLVRSNILPAEMYIKGLKSILENADDFAIDIPRIWEYLGDLVGPMVQDGSLPLSFLREAVEPCVASGTAGKLLSAVLHAAAGKLGSVKVGELWKKSGLQWTEFLSFGQSVDKFVEENKLGFTVSETKPLPDDHLSMEQIKEKLDFLLQKKKSTNEDILDWIEIHVGEERSKTPQFIRVLITAVVENAIEGEGSNCKFNNPAASERLSVLQKYLNNKEDFELQALYGLQALVNKLEHPKGLLLDMFNAFYDLDLLSDEAYSRWEQSTDPAEQEGKGVALKSVVPFFTWLKEAEDESADSN
ncbi:eukaryotic translation initiation factor 4 gamma 1-like isoform X2 [Tachypleus tridentatus]|uniref:eukaryotic translation initiation factor 4 gamma 1-like isoform X2 n=1 Tax=Tachypleus tridentatus TaxID=6853 RepID=UPI003FD119FB